MRTDSDLEPYPSLWPLIVSFFFLLFIYLFLNYNCCTFIARRESKINFFFFSSVWTVCCTLLAPDFEIFPPDTNVPLTPQDKTFHTDRESAFTHGSDGFHRLFIEVNLDEPIHHASRQLAGSRKCRK